MDIEAYRAFCMAKAGVTESMPFDNQVLVFKVMNKMFALTDIDLFTSVNLKCDPERAGALRETYPGVLPGYHMNKQHWNTVLMDGSIPDVLLLDWINDSYDLVAASLPKKDQETLRQLKLEQSN